MFTGCMKQLANVLMAFLREVTRAFTVFAEAAEMERVAYTEFLERRRRS